MFKGLIVLILCSAVLARSKDEWKSRTIYQVITDRFAGGRGECNNLRSWCGGNFQGIIDKLDYIIELGFNAIWISPIVDNYEDGYHGYYARNIYKINGHFGGYEGLKNLVQACHERDIWVMVDVVANHMGNRDQNYTANYPFNKPEHYHPYCLMTQKDYFGLIWDNIQNCRLADLSDIKQENPDVQYELLKWITYMVVDFNIDGLRIDTVPEVPKWFWKKFSDASKVFTLGEVNYPNMEVNAAFVGPINSVLNYPLFWELRTLFVNSTLPMSRLAEYNNKFKEIVGPYNFQYLGNFNDNHDNPRFLNENVTKTENLTLQQRKQANANIVAYTLLAEGIPIIYYGTEQEFDGGEDPFNREVLWNHFKKLFNLFINFLIRDTPMFKFIKAINEAKKATNCYNEPQVQLLSNNQLYAFSRGKLTAIFSNQYSSTLTVDIPLTEKVCDILNPDNCYIPGQTVNVISGTPVILIPH